MTRVIRPIEATASLMAVFEYLGYVAAQVPTCGLSWSAYAGSGVPTLHIGRW